MCGRLAAEWNLSMFSIEEVNSKTLNVQTTFTPTPKILVLLEKFTILGMCGYAAYLTATGTVGLFWFAFLTYISFLLCMLYFVLSTVSVLFIGERSQNELTVFDKIIWGLFAGCAGLEFFVTFNYWAMVYGPSSTLTFDTVFTHGIIFVLLLLDGFVVHRLPMRLKQVYIIVPLYMVYLIWTMHFH